MRTRTVIAALALAIALAAPGAATTASTSSSDGPPEGEYLDVYSEEVYEYDGIAVIYVGNLTGSPEGHYDLDLYLSGEYPRQTACAGCNPCPDTKQFCVDYQAALVGNHTVWAEVTITDCTGWTYPPSKTGEGNHDQEYFEDLNLTYDSSGTQDAPCAPGYVTATLYIDGQPAVIDDEDYGIIDDGGGGGGGSDRTFLELRTMEVQ